MKNKLRVTEYYYNDIEKNLVNFKMKLLDDKFTFNSDIFSFKYIIKLHEFLFDDLFDEQISGVRKLNKIEIDYFNQILFELKKVISIYPLDINYTLLLVEKIWHFQPFIVGNTRTMFAYLKILNNRFQLNININENMEIKSCSDMFKLKTYVNQKRLTK